MVNPEGGKRLVDEVACLASSLDCFHATLLEHLVQVEGGPPGEAPCGRLHERSMIRQRVHQRRRRSRREFKPGHRHCFADILHGLGDSSAM